MSSSLKRFLLQGAFVIVIAGMVWLVWSSVRNEKFHVGRPLPRGKVNPQIVSGSDGVAMVLPDGSLWFLHPTNPATGSTGLIGYGGSIYFTQLTPKFNGYSKPRSDAVFPRRLGSDSDWTRVAPGEGFLIALKSDGSLWEWTYSAAGSPQALSAGIIPAPTRIRSDKDWLEITAGIMHCLALKKNGSLWARGQNGLGQLGDGTTNQRNFFVQVGVAHDWKAISAGDFKSFALKSDGTVWGWGMSGSLPTRIPTNSDFSPHQLDSGTNWSAISAGRYHLLALKSDGTLWLRGWNAARSPPDNSTSFVQIGSDHDWREICSGAYECFARKQDGSWWAWGANFWGELGVTNGTIHNPTNQSIGWYGTNRPPFVPYGGVLSSPARLPFDFDPWVFAPSTRGDATTFLLTRDGTLWTWGLDYGTQRMAVLKIKLALNNFLAKLPGHKQPFDTEPTGSPIPRRYWQLPPPEVRQSLGKHPPPAAPL